MPSKPLARVVVAVNSRYKEKPVDVSETAVRNDSNGYAATTPQFESCGNSNGEGV